MGSYSLDAVYRPDSVIDVSCLGYLASIESRCTHGMHYIFASGVDLLSDVRVSSSPIFYIQSKLFSILLERGCFTKLQAEIFSRSVSTRMQVFSSFIVAAPTSMQAEDTKSAIESVFRSLWLIREHPIALRGPQLWRTQVISELRSVEMQFSQRESVCTAEFQAFQLYRQSFEQCSSRYFEYYSKMVDVNDDQCLEPLQAITSAIGLAKDILLCVLDIDKTLYIPPSEV